MKIINNNYRKRNIITLMNKFWNARGVFFGDKIHELKPNNQNEWKDYLVKNNFFLLSKKGYKKFKINQKQNKLWCWYLVNCFWKLYISETTALAFFKNNLNINLRFAIKQLDIKYGIDFYFTDQHSKMNFLIVKHGIRNFENLVKYKQLDFFKFQEWNLSNSTILLFDSKDSKLYEFNKRNSNFVEINVENPNTPHS